MLAHLAVSRGEIQPINALVYPVRYPSSHRCECGMIIGFAVFSFIIEDLTHK